MSKKKWGQNFLKDKKVIESIIKAANIQINESILEIGPGAGRWTEHLNKIAKKIILADITQKCLDICQQRFQAENNIEYNLIENGLDFLEDDSIDQILIHQNDDRISKKQKKKLKKLILK